MSRRICHILGVPDSAPNIEQLRPPLAAADLDDLAQLLTDAVGAGAAVSFVLPFSHADARTWWITTLESFPARGMLFAARAGGRIVGTVQLHPAWAPNQPHRADVAKLLVHSQFQSRGVGASLMRALETYARNAGFALLTLDAKAGTSAERLYLRLGWTAVGEIPRYAYDPSGPMHATVIMYRAL